MRYGFGQGPEGMETALLSLADERQHLAKADRNIAAGEKRIARQVELIEEMRATGQGVVEAEKLLAALRQCLETWRVHRDEILRTIIRLESRGAGAA
jgi:hypothetical protein